MDKQPALNRVWHLLILLLGVLFSTGCSRPAIATPNIVIPTTIATPNTPELSQGLKDINGTQLYYQLLGNGSPLILLHGQSGSHRYFLPHIAPLATEHQLLFYDQRGTGLSNERLDLSAISIDQSVEDLEALRITFGFKKISILAHSKGAIIALFYAFKYQNNIDKLILVDPVPLQDRFLVAQLHTIQQRVERLSPDAQQTLKTVCQRPNNALSAEEQATCLNLDAILRFYDPAKAVTMDTGIDKSTARNAATIESLMSTSLHRKQNTIETNLSSIHVPTLIIHGDFDPIPLDSSIYLQEHIPNAKLMIIKQSGHFPFVEQPEQFLAAVRAFLQ